MTDEYRELLIGAGHSREKRIEPWHFAPDKQAPEGARKWRGVLDTLDNNPRCKPDILWNLNDNPWSRPGPVRDLVLAPESYDEIHAYEVLEHFGTLGDVAALLGTFSEIWRLLKPGGFFCGTCPSRFSEWLWGDPGHTRPILPATLLYLNQPQYTAQLGVTSMSDYRNIYRADFDTLTSHDNHARHLFVLRAVKPSRWMPP